MSEDQIAPIEQEVGISLLRGDETILISASDRTFITKMESKGWRGERSNGYVNFRVPPQILTIRSRATVERGPTPAQRASARKNVEKCRRGGGGEK